MTWWQTLIVAVVPVFVTTTALLAQQILLDRRARREADLARQDSRVDRLESAHSEMLEALLEVWREVERPIDRAFVEYMRGDQPHFSQRDVRSPVLRPVDVALSRLAITERSEVVVLAERAMGRVLLAHALMQEVHSGVFEFNQQKFTEALLGFEKARIEYAATAAASLEAARG